MLDTVQCLVITSSVSMPQPFVKEVRCAHERYINRVVAKGTALVAYFSNQRRRDRLSESLVAYFSNQRRRDRLSESPRRRGLLYESLSLLKGASYAAAQLLVATRAGEASRRRSCQDSSTLGVHAHTDVMMGGGSPTRSNCPFTITVTVFSPKFIICSCLCWRSVFGPVRSNI